MVVWTIESGSGNDLEEPVEKSLVAHVHADGDGRLLTVSSEAPFPGENAKKEADLERAGCMFLVIHGTSSRRGKVVTPYGIT